MFPLQGALRMQRQAFVVMLGVLGSENPWVLWAPSH